MPFKLSHIAYWIQLLESNKPHHIIVNEVPYTIRYGNLFPHTFNTWFQLFSCLSFSLARDVISFWYSFMLISVSVHVNLTYRHIATKDASRSTHTYPVIHTSYSLDHSHIQKQIQFQHRLCIIISHVAFAQLMPKISSNWRQLGELC